MRPTVRQLKTWRQLTTPPEPARPAPKLRVIKAPAERARAAEAPARRRERL